VEAGGEPLGDDVFIPLYDYNPVRHIKRPWVTWILIAINVAVFVVFQSEIVMQIGDRAAIMFGVTPADIGRGVRLPTAYGALPEELTLVTYMFLHGGWIHLIGNMLFLWVFGDNVEDAMGHVRFIAFYLSCGVAGAVAHVLSMKSSTVPLVGASGAIAGIIAAYLILHPRVKIWVLAFGRIPLKLSAAWVLGIWVAFQALNILASTDDNTSWWGHVGGLIAGAALILVMRRPDTELFDRGLGMTARVDTHKVEP
jgi:membrane associated rhomboid family serine protease